MALDLLQESVDGGVGANGAPAPALAVGPGQAGVEPLLVGVLEQSLDGPPMLASKRAQRLALSHAVPLARNGRSCRSVPGQ